MPDVGTMVGQGSRGVINIEFEAPVPGRVAAQQCDIVELQDGSFKIQPRDNRGQFLHVCPNLHLDVNVGQGEKEHIFDVVIIASLVAAGPLERTLVSQVSGVVGFAGSVTGVSGQPGTLNIDFTNSGCYAQSTDFVGGTIFVGSISGASPA